MPGFEKRRIRTRGQASKLHQLSTAAEETIQHAEPCFQGLGREAPSSAACGVKRKRDETPSNSDASPRTETDSDESFKPDSPVSPPRSRRSAGSDQQKSAKKGSGKASVSRKQTPRARRTDDTGTTAKPVSENTAGDRSEEAKTTSAENPLDAQQAFASPAATAAAVFAGFGSAKSQTSKRGSAPSALAAMVPRGAGVTSFSQVAQKKQIPTSRKSGLAALATAFAPQPPESNTARVNSSPAPVHPRQAAQRASQPAAQEAAVTPVVPTEPCHGAACFPYFEAGFMTQPFSVSAFVEESQAVLRELQDCLSEVQLPDEEVDMEAASLRVPPLEEQTQTAIQALAIPMLPAKGQTSNVLTLSAGDLDLFSIDPAGTANTAGTAGPAGTAGTAGTAGPAGRANVTLRGNAVRLQSNDPQASSSPRADHVWPAHHQDGDMPMSEAGASVPSKHPVLTDLAHQVLWGRDSVAASVLGSAAASGLPSIPSMPDGNRQAQPPQTSSAPSSIEQAMPWLSKGFPAIPSSSEQAQPSQALEIPPIPSSSPPGLQPQTAPIPSIPSNSNQAPISSSSSMAWHAGSSQQAQPPQIMGMPSIPNSNSNVSAAQASSMHRNASSNGQPPPLLKTLGRPAMPSSSGPAVLPGMPAIPNFSETAAVPSAAIAAFGATGMPAIPISTGQVQASQLAGMPAIPSSHGPFPQPHAPSMPAIASSSGIAAISSDSAGMPDFPNISGQAQPSGITGMPSTPSSNPQAAPSLPNSMPALPSSIGQPPPDMPSIPATNGNPATAAHPGAPSGMPSIPAANGNAAAAAAADPGAPSGMPSIPAANGTAASAATDAGAPSGMPSIPDTSGTTATVADPGALSGMPSIPGTSGTAATAADTEAPSGMPSIPATSGTGVTDPGAPVLLVGSSAANTADSSTTEAAASAAGDRGRKEASAVEPQPQYRSISESKAQAVVQQLAQNREVVVIKEKFAKNLAEAAKVLRCVNEGMNPRNNAAKQRLVRNQSVVPECVRPVPRLAQEGAMSQDEVVLTWSIHRFDRPGWKLMDVAVLGSQKLTALRDIIKCEADANMQAKGLQQPSAFFYIEGDFYSDMRGLHKDAGKQKDAADISDSVVEFCKEHNIRVPPAAPSPAPPYPPACAKAPQIEKSSLCEPRQQDMDATTFKDLFLRVGQGAGYVYMHQGCCEHLIELADVHCAHDANPADTRQYPCIIKQAERKRRDCCICNPDGKTGVRSRMVTYNDPHAPCNPCYWCDSCYHSMHYNQAGDLVYTDFQAFPYQYEHGIVKQMFKTGSSSHEESKEPD